MSPVVVEREIVPVLVFAPAKLRSAPPVVLPMVMFSAELNPVALLKARTPPSFTVVAPLVAPRALPLAAMMVEPLLIVVAPV